VQPPSFWLASRPRILRVLNKWLPAAEGIRLDPMRSARVTRVQAMPWLRPENVCAKFIHRRLQKAKFDGPWRDQRLRLVLWGKGGRDHAAQLAKAFAHMPAPAQCEVGDLHDGEYALSPSQTILKSIKAGVADNGTVVRSFRDHFDRCLSGPKRRA
jgi:hypothetical protein